MKAPCLGRAHKLIDGCISGLAGLLGCSGRQVQAAACGTLLAVAQSDASVAQQLCRNSDLPPLLLGMLSPKEPAPQHSAPRVGQYREAGAGEDEQEALLKVQAAGRSTTC
jgi:hypothetical protein